MRKQPLETPADVQLCRKHLSVNCQLWLQTQPEVCVSSSAECMAHTSAEFLNLCLKVLLDCSSPGRQELSLLLLGIMAPK